MNRRLLGALALLLITQSSFATQLWQTLDASQQQALAPVAQQWSTFSDKQQRALLRVAKRYPSLSPTEKQRLQKKLTAWSKLTPEQRNAAREKYQAFKQNPALKEIHVRQLKPRKPAVPVLAQSAVISSVPIASAVSSVTRTN